jgi:hypothetical protein
MASLLVFAILLSAVAPAMAVPPTPTFGREIDPYAAHQGQKTCDPSAKPGTIAFRQMVLASYPGTRDSGITRNCNSGGTSEHKEGRAWDWGARVNVASERASADNLIAWLLATDAHGNRHANARRLGIMYIIWNKRIWKAYDNPGTWHSYTGANPHTDHVHFSFSSAGAQKQTTWWNAASPGEVVWAVNGCRALVEKRSYWGPWVQNMPCGQASKVAVSPDGGTILVVTADGALVGKHGEWGTWQTLLGSGDAKSAAVAPGDVVWAVTGCGALYSKRTYTGPWVQNMPCGQASQVALSPDGGTVMVITADGALVGKHGEWGTWGTHLGPGDARSVDM